MAWTEKYVAPGGTAAWADATDPGDPADFDEIVNAVSGERANIVEGSYSPTQQTFPEVYMRGYISTPGDLESAGRSLQDLQATVEIAYQLAALQNPNDESQTVAGQPPMTRHQRTELLWRLYA